MRKPKNPRFFIVGMLALALVLGLAPAVAVFAQTPTTIIINEVDADQVSTDSAEFIELYDGGVGNTDLSGLSLVLYNGSDDLSYIAFDLDGQSTNGSGYFVLCANAATVANCDLDVSPDTNLIQNGEDAVALLVGDAVDYPNDTALPADGDIVDAIVYETGSDADSGLLVLLNAGQGVVNEGGNGDQTGHSNQRCANGSGGARNTDAYTQAAPSPGTENTCEAPGTPSPTEAATEAPSPTPTTAPPATAPDVLINEIRIDQGGSDVDEYFELAGAAGTSLDGVTYIVIGDGSTGSGTIEAVVDLTGSTIPGSGLFVAAEGTFSLAAADLTANLNFENSDNVTHMLVFGFTGSNGDDLDTNDDGTLDSTPWSDVLDSIALVESPGSGDKFYGPNTIGPDGSFVPAHVYRCEDGWRIGSFSLGADDTPTEANDCPPPPPPGGICGDSATMIFDIQGSGASSPLVGAVYVIEGVVVGDFQLSSQLSGFFVQEEDAEVDADPATSDGIFVFAPGASDVSLGDVVRVQGTVTEFFGLTRLDSIASLTVCGTGGTATAALVSLPVSSIGDFEAFEGMAVTFPQTLYIAEFFNFDRFGEMVLTTARQFTPTGVFEPGSVDQANLALANSLSRITLDDGRDGQNPDPALHPNGSVFDMTNLFRGGDSLDNVTGVMNYSFGLYRVVPTQGADYTSLNPRPALPDDVGGTLTVASFNVLNYFSTLDNAGSICGPLGNQGCRGADNANEFTRQRDKIINAIVTMDADIVGLMEIENHAADAAVANLVSGLNAVAGAGTYAAINTGPIGDDVIKVGLIYQPASVTPVGPFAILDASVDATYNDDKNRVALAQTFEENATGGRFTAVVNHLKSKGSSCASIGDPDLGDGQANCNLTRTSAAAAEAAWLATDPTGSGDADFLIIGDLNAYDKEDPIDAFLAGGYTDLLRSFVGEFAYSFVFDGQLGYLDHALANANLIDQVTGSTVWHINTDEPDLIDYDTSFKKPAQDALYAPDAYRSSDHDPVLMGLDLNGSPDCSNASPSIASLWPLNFEFHSIYVLGVTDPENDAISIMIDSIFQDELVDGTGDGNFAPDGQGVGSAIAEVRAERAGTGNGRVYHISFTADDGKGNSCSGVVQVGVAKSKNQDGGPVDDGPIYDSTDVAP